jgi:DNA-binding transcriptional MerR regulator/effector-binding domain-containing protein
MFRIGEFSHIARVSTRSLRYYDQLGLLEPGFVDPETGYRHYTANQLPRLNRILALKDIGLSLDEVAGLIDREVSADELRGMLVVKKSELEHELAHQQARLRLVETRIDEIDTPSDDPVDLIVREAPPRPFLSARHVCQSTDEGLAMFGHIADAADPYRARLTAPFMGAVWKSDFTKTAFDLEVGLVGGWVPERLKIEGGFTLNRSEIPAARVVSMTRVGPAEFAHGVYGSVGRWLEKNELILAGEIRELVLELPDDRAGVEAVVELEFPIGAETDF